MKYGASMILTHLKQDTTGGGYTLNVANTGLGDAILCHGSQVTPLTVAHNPATNRDEVRRIVKEKGFISEVSRERERETESRKDSLLIYYRSATIVHVYVI